MNYQSMIEGIGLEAVVWVDQGDYQGDSWAIVRSGYSGPYGYLVFGWGSCSGCDALESAMCESEPDRSKKVIEILLGLVSSIHWEGEAYIMAGWLASKDWSAEFYADRSEFKDFLAQAKAKLAPKP